MNNKTSLVAGAAALLIILGGATWVGMQGDACKDSSCEKKVEFSASIDEEARALGVRIVPRKLLEDSRCPMDVQCIQAGTVRVEADLESGLGKSVVVFKLGESITTEAETITFLRVEPGEKRAGVEVPMVQYRFMFEVKKR
ncbi:MAG: hypothetical protein V4674_02695 [Patescibacteria group bacterium]